MAISLNPTLTVPIKTTFGEPKFHTDGDVLAVCFGKEGWLYSIEESGALRKWNSISGQQMGWSVLSDLETLWVFSSDGRVIASAADDVTIWDASSGQILTSILQPSWVTALAFAPETSFLATGHDSGAIGYWDAPGHHPVFPKGLAFHKKPISALAISPNGKTLAAASEDKTISLWDLATGKYIGCLSGHTDRIAALAWHPSSKFLVSAGWDTTARVWDAATLEPVILLNAHATQLHALAFSRDGKWLACADSSHSVRVWDFDAKKSAQVLKITGADAKTLAFSPDGKQLAANGDRIVHVWNPQTGAPSVNLGPRPLAKTSVSVSPDGSRLLTNAGGAALQLWNAAAGNLDSTVDPGETLRSSAFSPDGKWIAGAVGRTIRLWDASGNAIATWEGPEHAITSLAFSSDSTLLASASSDDTSAWIWRVADGEPVLLIPDALEGCAVEALAFIPGKHLLAVGGIDWMATGGSNGAVSIWNLTERAEIGTFFDGATAIAIHPAGEVLAAATLDHAVCLWDIDLKLLQQELVGHDGAVTALAFSPDGAWLASGSEDLTIRLWNASGQERIAWELESQATSLTFSPDGQFLYVGHANTTCSRIQLPKSLASR
jgi:WD40 repeat protein